MNEIIDTFYYTNDLDLIKNTAKQGEYIDKNGLKWSVTSTNIEQLPSIINRRFYTKKTNTNKTKLKYEFLKLYWLKQEDFAELSINFTFGPTTTLDFYHKHDIKIKVATIYGKPKDLTKYTKYY